MIKLEIKHSEIESKQFLPNFICSFLPASIKHFTYEGWLAEKLKSAGFDLNRSFMQYINDKKHVNIYSQMDEQQLNDITGWLNREG